MNILLSLIRSISSLSKSCYSHIRQIRCIRPYLDSKTASTIAASIVHSKLDYCNSLYYNLPKSQINCLQQIQNILRSLHWLKINERIEYKFLSLTYKVLTTSQPDYSSVVTLARPSVSLSLQITNRSFRCASPHLWNQLPSSFRQPHCVHSPPGSPHPTYITSSQSSPSFSPSVTPSTFHSRLKAHLFHKSFPP